MTITTEGVPDLLQRFVATPFSTKIFIDGVEIALQSNIDLADIDGLSAPLSNDSADKLCATIVRDAEAPADECGVTIIKAWPVATVLIGSGTVLALDCGRSQLIGFLAPTLSMTRFVSEFLPMLVGLYRQLQVDRKPRTFSTDDE
jgi:hypothetical protein